MYRTLLVGVGLSEGNLIYNFELSGRLVPAKMDRLGANYGWNDAVCAHKLGTQTL